MPRGAHSCGASARPPPPRRAPSGPTSPPPRGVPASGAAPPTGLDLQNHRPRGARAAKPIQSPHFFATDRPKAAPGVHLAPALLLNPWPRTPHAAFLRHTPKRGAKRPGFGDTAPATDEQVRRPGPRPLVPEPHLRGRRRPAPRPRDNHRPRGGPRRLAQDVAPAPRRLSLIHDTSLRRF